MSYVNPTELILKAQQFERDGYFLEAWRYFTEAIDLIKVLIPLSANEEKMASYTKKLNNLESYRNYLQTTRIEPDNQRVKTVRIENGTVGNSYAKLFGDYMDDRVKEVHINETYVFEKFQLENLICFLELLVKKCKNLRYICLFTLKFKSQTEPNRDESLRLRKDTFDNLIKDMKNYGIEFCYRFQPGIHDRRILLGNGTTFVLGRGLDIYQTSKTLSLGSFDYDLRKCKQTTVDILQLPKKDNIF